MQTNEEIRQKIREGHRYKTGTRGFFAKAAAPCFRTCLSTAFIFFFLDILALKINTAETIMDQKQTLQEFKQIKFTKFCLNESPDSQKYSFAKFCLHESQKKNTFLLYVLFFA
jgi:hypothetical protein